jgi:aromatic-L-amino-acid decarboxylase
LKTYGTEKLGEVITRTCALAAYLETRILAEPRLELLAPVQLNIVCFRYRAADANKVNGDIVIDIQESGIAAPSTTLLDGQLAIRAAIVNHRTDTRDLDALVAAVVRVGMART